MAGAYDRAADGAAGTAAVLVTAAVPAASWTAGDRDSSHFSSCAAAVLSTGRGRRGPGSGASEGADADFAASETEPRNDPGSGGGARAAPSGTGAAGPRE